MRFGVLAVGLHAGGKRGVGEALVAAFLGGASHCGEVPSGAPHDVGGFEVGTFFLDFLVELLGVPFTFALSAGCSAVEAGLPAGSVDMWCCLALYACAGLA